uniref:Uncharacterized protein n=1 Tax=Coccidioides posadasii RMSCC 3488 TaxID=454284 RepID=A0A0J6IGK7_COCPO|nr:hypothetical protein CPAG_07276 [Coccidioides posadasii RMSCC 3488]
MPKKVSYEDLEERADANGYIPENPEISAEPEQRKLSESPEREYGKVWAVWKRCSEKHGDNILDEKTMRDFIVFLASSARGQKKNEPRPKASYIMERWKQFIAEWARRQKQKMPSRVTNSGTHLISNSHFKHLLEQLWGHDWHEYFALIYRVYHSAILKMSMYSSARQGEYVESNARGQSGRGMYVPDDLTFVVIRDRNGQAQMVVRPKRDAKNMNNEDKQPRHPMQENIGPNPLYLNPVLEPLVICLACGLFRDFKTADEIFALEPPPYEKAYELVLDCPTIDLYDSDSRGFSTFFEKIENGALTGQILTGNWAGSELRKLGFCTGYEKPPTVHALCREGLVQANEEGYSMEEKAQFAGHGLNPRIFFESYMSSTSSVQGVLNILKLDCEENLAEPFRGLTLRRHPKLWQALPAKLQEDLEDNAECAELNDQIIKLTEMIETASSDEQSQNLEVQQ